MAESASLERAAICPVYGVGHYNFKWRPAAMAARIGTEPLWETF